MKLATLNPQDRFIFDGDGWRPHTVLEQKGEMTFCTAPSGKRQYYKSDEDVRRWSECLKCMPGMPCPFCNGTGFLLYNS